MAVRGCVARHPVRHGIRGGPSCRNDRRSDRRAVRHVAADDGNHHHRGGTDRVHHARRQAAPTLARDTVFAVVMIVCNGLVGLCIFIGGLRYREQDFQVSGSNLYLSVLFVMATITLIMPNYTLTAPGPIYSAAQLGFVSVVTLILYAVFLYTQTIRHRDYFISDNNGGAADGSLLSN